MKLRSVVLGSLALVAWASAAPAQYNPGGPGPGSYRPGQNAPQQPQYGPPVQQPQYGPPVQQPQHGPPVQQPQYPAQSQTGPSTSHRFGERRHLVRLARNLETQANEVCWEMHQNYKHVRNWDETYRMMYDILQDAKHVRQLVREQYRGAPNQDHIADDLHDMDRLFDRVLRRVSRWEPPSAPRNVPVNDVRDLRDPRQQPVSELRLRLQRFDGTLNHLMIDYGVKSRLEQRAEGRYTYQSQIDAPPPPGVRR